jgi:hypothetical protein
MIWLVMPCSAPVHYIAAASICILKTTSNKWLQRLEPYSRMLHSISTSCSLTSLGLLAINIAINGTLLVQSHTVKQFQTVVE